MTLGVSQVISDSFQMLKSRFGRLLGLYLIFFVIQMVLFSMFGGMFMGLAMTGGNFESVGAGAMAGMLIFYLVYFLVSFAQSAALSHQASPLHDPNLGDSLGAGVRSALPLLGITVLLGLAYFVCALVIGFVVAMLAQMPSPIGGILSFVAIVAILIGVIYLACRLAVIGPVVAIDRIGNPVAALQRTWALTRGNALQIFLVILVIGAISVVAMLLLAAPFISALMSAGASGTPPSIATIGTLGAFSIVGLVAASVLLALLWAAVGSAIHAGLNRHLGVDSSEVFS